MKPATVHQLKRELQTRTPDELLQLCLRLAKFKKENKELLTYRVKHYYSLTPLSSRFDRWLKKATYSTGVDGILNTADDEIFFYVKTVIDEDTEEITKARSISHTGPGSDGEWFTSDDVLNWYRKYSISENEHGQEIFNTVEFYDPGADGIWFSGDDVARDYTIPPIVTIRK